MKKMGDSVYTLEELRAMTRTEVIQKAISRARGVESALLPEDLTGVKVFVSKHEICVELGKGYMAETRGSTRCISSVVLKVTFSDGSTSTRSGLGC